MSSITLSNEENIWSLTGHQSAVHEALSILELLERIMYILSPRQRQEVRLVSRSWDRASYRPRWQYPSTLMADKMEVNVARLVPHGNIVLELNLKRPDRIDTRYEWMLSREQRETVIARMVSLCPNVRSLCLPYESLRDNQVEELILLYGTKRVLSHRRKLEGLNSEPHAMISQLHTLRLDLSFARPNPISMDIFTAIGQGLKTLELKLNLEEQAGSNNVLDGFFKFGPLLENCGRYLQDLEVIPAPQFGDVVGTNGETKNTTSTAATLGLFEVYRPPLTRLHLGGVWFSESDIAVLAKACPMISDLRISNEEKDGNLTMRELIAIEHRDWYLYYNSFEYKQQEQRKKFLSVETILKLWGPRLSKLRLDGNRIGMHSIAEGGQEITVARNDTSNDINPSRHVAALPYRLTSLCLYHTTGLSDQQLIGVIDTIKSTLQLLNVDRNIFLTDSSIRHVLMSCPGLTELSAAELNLTMALFEDSDIIEDSIPEVDLENRNYEAVKRKWACVDCLRSLDLSWRSTDGRAAHVKISEGTDDYDRILNSWDRNLKPYYHHRVFKEIQRRREARRKEEEKEREEMARNELLQSSEEDTDYSQDYGSKNKPWKPRIPIELMQRVLPMFSKPWQIESIYERIRILGKLEVLQLQGWLIPWRSADMMVFLGSSQENESVSVDDPLSLTHVSRMRDDNDWESIPETSPKSFNGKEADLLLVNYSKDSLITRLYQHYRLSIYPNETLRSPPSGVSYMTSLKYLNIMCRQPILMDENISPFEHWGDEDFSIKSNSTFAPSLIATESKKLDPALFKRQGPYRMVPLPPAAGYEEVLLYSVLGEFMKACPQLETINVRTPSLRKIPESKLGKRLSCIPFSIQLATSKGQFVELDRRYGMTPDVTSVTRRVVGVSERNVRCSSDELLPEFSIIRYNK
ncbi:hypothetical protein BGZ76_011279 [Entomortierella beljakovae]|nr:hypothetical protein BGZ76_011279 [Entomortierella beljakovae]